MDADKSGHFEQDSQDFKGLEGFPSLYLQFSGFAPMLSGRHDGNPFNPYKSLQSWFIPSERPLPIDLQSAQSCCWRGRVTAARGGSVRTMMDADKSGHFEQDSQDFKGLEGFPS